MSPRPPGPSRDQLITAATDLFRRNGFVATTVDQICREAEVSKGAFFHHFESKEALMKACLKGWGENGTAMFDQGPFQTIEDPVGRVVECMEFLIGIFSQPGLLKSCLAGTAVQELSETHPEICGDANECFVAVQDRFRELLDAACEARGVELDTASLSALWWATIQGSLVLVKASKDESVIPRSLEHVKAYIQSLFA